ncbi:MAG: hypothetical protein ACTSRC_22550 [Candidatus Helarchaeota archaeon]
MDKLKIRFIIFLILVIGFNTFNGFYYYFNPPDFFEIFLYVILANILMCGMLIYFISLLWHTSRTCLTCEKPPRFILTNYSWRLGRASRYEKYCKEHFLETFQGELDQLGGKFIFFKEDRYFKRYIYLSLKDLEIHPAKYTSQDLSQVTNLIETISENCEKCNSGGAKVLLMSAKVIDFTVRSPLIKYPAYTQNNESLCTRCFIDFLSREITLRNSEFKDFWLNLPYDYAGIYLFEQ